MYVSTNARRIITVLSELGARDETDGFPIERAIASFWDSHIEGVIRSIAGRSDPDKWKSQGYGYFEKPIWSMLQGRKAAWRADAFRLPDSDEVRRVYQAVSGFVLADFTFKELKLIYEISRLITDPGELSAGFRAARERNVRNVFYLHGIISREAGQRNGRLAEIRAERARQDQSDGGNQPEFERLGPIERKLVIHDWEEKMANKALDLAMEKYAADQRLKSRS